MKAFSLLLVVIDIFVINSSFRYGALFNNTVYQIRRLGKFYLGGISARRVDFSTINKKGYTDEYIALLSLVIKLIP